MARESGEMSGVHDRDKLRHPADLIDRESRRRRRPSLTMRSRISSSVDLVPPHRLIRVSAQAAIMAG